MVITPICESRSASLDPQFAPEVPTAITAELVAEKLAPEKLAIEKLAPEKLVSEKLTAEKLLAFDWRELTVLGISWEEARSIATKLIAKRLMLIYWKRLIGTGVPLVEARRIARAIAKFDTAQIPPSPYQQTLIQQYCPAVCRAALWRVEMLLPSS